MRWWRWAVSRSGVRRAPAAVLRGRVGSRSGPAPGGTCSAGSLRTWASAAADRKRLYYPAGTIPPETRLDEVRAKWHSDAMERIDQVPPIVVDREVIACDGGPSLDMGHPIEYIRVEEGDPEPSVCKYCGLRYIHRKAPSRADTPSGG